MKIRPAVAMDGGDIQLKNYKDGVAEVLLKEHAGCPSSTITLKHVERMIKHYVPEVNSVEALNFDESNYSYIESLIEPLEKVHEVEEYQFYRDRGRKLTIKQLELILLKSDRTTERSNTKTVKK